MDKQNKPLAEKRKEIVQFAELDDLRWKELMDLIAKQDKQAVQRLKKRADELNWYCSFDVIDEIFGEFNDKGNPENFDDGMTQVAPKGEFEDDGWNKQMLRELKDSSDKKGEFK